MQSLAYEENDDGIELYPSVMLTTILPPFMESVKWSRINDQIVDAFVDAH
jgi:hypothetical protein